MEQDRRTTVLELFRVGNTARDIITLTKYPASTVYRTIQRFKKEGTTHRSKHRPRSDRKRFPRFVAGLNKSIRANPGTPMTVLAKNRDVHVSTISRAIRHNLGYKSYVLKVRHLLTEPMKVVRMERCKKILNSLKSTGGHLRFFSDEKVFTVDKKRNRQNDRWICKEPSEVPMVFRSKNPASVMVLGVISSQGHVMPPHFFRPKEKVNQQVYLEVLQDVIKPWMDRITRDARCMKYTFQQDSAPAHKAKTVQVWLRDNVPHFWDPQTWPSNSPDLNPCDYYL